MSQIPQAFKGLFWSRKLKSLDFQKDKAYIIHQVLAYGSLGQIKWLAKLYSQKEIIKIFLYSPRKNYSPQSFNFVKNFLLPLEKQKIAPNSYVKAVSGDF